MFIFPCADVLTGTGSGQRTPPGWNPPAECAPGDADPSLGTVGELQTSALLQAVRGCCSSFSLGIKCFEQQVGP